MPYILRGSPGRSPDGNQKRRVDTLPVHFLGVVTQEIPEVVHECVEVILGCVDVLLDDGALREKRADHGVVLLSMDESVGGLGGGDHGEGGGCVGSRSG